MEAQPRDGGRPVTGPAPPGSALPGVGLLGNAAQSGWETPSKAKYRQEDDSQQVRECKCEKSCEERVQEGVKPLRGKRMGSAPSARGIQPGGSGRPFRCVSDPLWGPPPGLARPPPGALPPAAVRRDRLWVG